MGDRRRIRRGDVWWLDWNPSRGAEQAGRRLALIVQADFMNEEQIGSIVVLAMSTGSHGDDALHVDVPPSRLNGLSHQGVIKCEQVLTVSVDRLETYSGILEPRYMERVNYALKMILGLQSP